MDRALQGGFHVIDMHPIFKRHYRSNKKKFEFENDWHWNGLAHSIAANNILNSYNLGALLKSI
jgi:hypothetical protein